MKILPFDNLLPGMLVLGPVIYDDHRGHFFESWSERDFSRISGTDVRFVQDNRSMSRPGVLRGLHYQVEQPQGKLISVLRGSIFDVAVDLRRSSPTYGKWFGLELSDQNRMQAWLPPGLAHGFVARSSDAEILYKTTGYYSPEHERCIVWDDPKLKIDWGLTQPPILSDKDKAGLLLDEAETYP